ncbi:DNA-protecting protein DprA [Candidatus Peregrinibacteria bacterium]|nr:DNA-protecting protein DprA [Candidatus Peregrinibacteria bacterium]
MKEAACINAFWKVEGASYAKMDLIKTHFGSFDYVWNKAKDGELKLLGIGFAENILRARRLFDPENELRKLWSKDIFLIDRNSDEYPEPLKQIDKAPFLLYRKGEALKNYKLLVAIVGMRKSTMNGEKIAFNLTKKLAEYGVNVISGLAFGIDGAAQAGAVFAKVPTIGVLASGIDKITPSSHTDLARRILESGGTILSEYPDTTEGMKFRFVERNRIISALAQAVVVVEAAEKSGALITAKYGLDQGKEVLAFPGDPGKIQSKGCNNLIKNGEAHLVENCEDIIEHLKTIGYLKNKPKQLDFISSTIISMLENKMSVEEIAGKAQISHQDLLCKLSELEITGRIRKVDLLNWQAI